MVTLDRGSELAFAFGGGFFVELAGGSSVRRPVFSTVRLKRRSATSKGSFSLTRTVGMKLLEL